MIAFIITSTILTVILVALILASL